MKRDNQKNKLKVTFNKYGQMVCNWDAAELQHQLNKKKNK